MAITTSITNLRAHEVAHPQVVGGIAAGATKTFTLPDINSDDYSVDYPDGPAFGLAIISDGVAVPGTQVVTGVTTLTSAQAVVVDATAPFTITLEDAATAGDGFKLFILIRSSLGVAATSVLTFGGNALNTEIVTIDTKVYTFQDTLTDVDGNVHIGVSASATLDNLIAAITLGGGAGTDYATSMTLHPTVTGAAGAGDTMDATAKTAGTAGNSIVTTTDVTSGSWTAGTMAGGDAAGDILVDAAGADTVLGGADTTLADAGDVLRLVVDGTDWEAQT